MQDEAEPSPNRMMDAMNRVVRDRLHTVLKLCGKQGVLDVLEYAGHVTHFRDLKPERWARAIGYANTAIRCAQSHEFMEKSRIHPKRYQVEMQNHKNDPDSHPPSFVIATDDWFEQCELQLKARCPNYFDSLGKPLPL
jgi:hypothetical protein